MPEPRSSANDPSSHRASTSRATSGRAARKPSARSRSAADEATSLAAGLSYNEARTALDLTMAALQASDLAVEDMAALYRRATAYATRCRELLEAVEQEVVQWGDPPNSDG